MRQDRSLSRVHGLTPRYAKAIGLVLTPTAIVVFGFTISSYVSASLFPSNSARTSLSPGKPVTGPSRRC